eukprot:1634821-Lingulodinium_polyedra.AAC.1
MSSQLVCPRPANLVKIKISIALRKTMPTARRSARRANNAIRDCTGPNTCSAPIHHWSPTG